MKRFNIALKPKGTNELFIQKQIEAENLAEAEKKAKEWATKFKAKDEHTKDYIDKCGGVEAVITAL